ncbi:putative glutathione S-transferase 5 [Ditylenchus destructor]|uniref:glutathione transferase n=1 Tax=Ditylenchus destructor TaxID=166010 RepID=A0AAD4MZZ6_9BILA|nr:putative glutathione S-transferase 5 [Ditylenchus destructor]
MVQYKLTYFDVRGLGEMSRCILAYAGAEYEDHRITHEQWPALKPTMPYEQLPVLEVDGVKIPQSFAIARFLAKRFELAGKTDVESALLDSIMDLQKDFQVEVHSYFMVAMGRKEGDKDKLYKEVFVPAAERHFPRCIKLLKESGSGFYGKSGVSWVDFHMASSVLTLKHFAPDILKKYPELQSHCDRVHALPQLQSYLAKRKETQV